MKVKELIKDKGFEVIAVDGDTILYSALQKMADRNIGALLIVEGGKTTGIFTERDALRCWSKHFDVDKVKIAEVMTRNLLVASLEDDLDEVMSVMIKRGVRHMPVMDKDRLISVLSMRDVVKAQVKNLEAEVHYLKDFISDIG